MKPRVITKCVANAYTPDNERIIEFSDGAVPEAVSGGVTGGLISFRRTTHDDESERRLQVSVYRLDGPVDVIVGGDTTWSGTVRSELTEDLAMAFAVHAGVLDSTSLTDRQKRAITRAYAYVEANKEDLR